MALTDEFPLRTDGGTDGGDVSEEASPAADGGLPTGPVPPDDETPTFADRKA